MIERTRMQLQANLFKVCSNKNDNSNPICPKCTGWMDLVNSPVDGAEWMKCRLCGYMFKSGRKKVTPL